MDDPYARKERKQRMIDLMETGDWAKILKEFDDDRSYREPLLVWVRPSLPMLKFIKDEVMKLKLNKETTYPYAQLESHF